MRARCLTALLSLLPLLACVSSGPSPIDGRSRVDRNSPARPIILQTEGATSEQAIAAPADEVWPALVATYESLGIPFSEVAGTRTVENRGYPARRIDGQRMSRFFDCGGPSELRSGQLHTVARVTRQTDGCTLNDDVFLGGGRLPLGCDRHS